MKMQTRSRGASSASELCRMTTTKIRCASRARSRTAASGFRTRSRTRKREAERRKAHCPTNVRAKRGCAPLSLPSSAACRRGSGRGTPPFGAHACGTRHRLLPRWLSPGTGFPAALAGGFCPLRQTMPQLSTLRADRSYCRSTGDPEPPGCGWQAARGHRASLSSLRHAFRKGALNKARWCSITETGTRCQGKSDTM